MMSLSNSSPRPTPLPVMISCSWKFFVATPRYGR